MSKTDIPGIIPEDVVFLGKKKAGDGFSYTISLEDQDTGVKLVGLTPRMKAQVKVFDRSGKGTLLGTFSIREDGDNPGDYILSMPTSTEDWPLSLVYFDAQYQITEGAEPESTPTFSVLMVRGITTNA